MSRRTLVKLLLLLSFAAAGLAGGLATVGAEPEDGFVLGESAPPAEIPALTAEQETRAQSIVSNDTWLRTFLGGQAYVVDGVGPWYNDDAGLMGAAVSISWANAITKSEATYRDVTDYMNAKEMQDMSLRCVDSYCPPYRTGTARYSVSGATTMLLQVDLTSNTVVHSQVGTEATLTPSSTEPADTVEHD
jgi:hypothetical protein